jgi:hypothetical protein
VSSFTVGEKTYELIRLEQLPDMELNELEVLEEVGGINLRELEDIAVTVRLVKALVYVSMRRSDPAATIEDAGHVKLSVLNALAGEVANTNGDAADPPTGRGRSGRRASASASDSSPGS